jgi:predicted CXXCH cytochrome family protein
LDLSHSCSRIRWIAAGLLLVSLAVFAQGIRGKRIIRPVDGSAFDSGEVEVLAAAPDGRLALDGEVVSGESPFPNVLRAVLAAAPGEHVLSLTWDGGSDEVKFFVGDDHPEGYQAFRPHPPGLEVECTQCHSVSRRGRFRASSAGCFDCHQKDAFVEVHPHQPHVLERCGLCHNPHGSTSDDHLIAARDVVCTSCHNL